MLCSLLQAHNETSEREWTNSKMKCKEFKRKNVETKSSFFVRSISLSLSLAKIEALNINIQNFCREYSCTKSLMVNDAAAVAFHEHNSRRFTSTLIPVSRLSTISLSLSLSFSILFTCVLFCFASSVYMCLCTPF